mmetsp:Transcript_47645/g.98794  ORF Transcript_47645/g.98794 Transcript_47645/m.98794 type:complete len:312 (-) Transcript_47645:718-1653(-)
MSTGGKRASMTQTCRRLASSKRRARGGARREGTLPALSAVPLQADIKARPQSGFSPKSRSSSSASKTKGPSCSMEDQTVEGRSTRVSSSSKTKEFQKRRFIGVLGIGSDFRRASGARPCKAPSVKPRGLPPTLDLGGGLGGAFPLPLPDADPGGVSVVAGDGGVAPFPFPAPFGGGVGGEPLPLPLPPVTGGEAPGGRLCTPLAGGGVMVSAPVAPGLWPCSCPWQEPSEGRSAATSSSSPSRCDGTGVTQASFCLRRSSSMATRSLSASLMRRSAESGLAVGPVLRTGGDSLTAQGMDACFTHIGEAQDG